MESLTKTILSDLRYLTSSDVSMRLKDTIVMYRGDPVYVRQPIAPETDSIGLHISCRNLRTEKEFVCHSSDVDLDISSLPLGWVNSPETIVFLARMTRTSQRQGVHLHSVYCYLPAYSDSRQGYNYGGLSELKTVVDMFDNKIFSIADITAKPIGGALNREWALIPLGRNTKGYFTIYHRSVEVGTYIQRNKEFFFRRHRLTKTRRQQLQDIISANVNQGVRYAIVEQI